METILFLLLAYIGGTIGIKLKMPAGALLGSMLCVGLISMFNLVEFDNISPIVRLSSQIALGTMIGLMFTKEILQLSLRQLFGFVLLGLFGVCSAIVIAIAFNFFEFLPFITGVIAVAPGGITEMLTLADSIGEDAQAVVVVHLIRFVTIMLILRWILQSAERRVNNL